MRRSVIVVLALVLTSLLTISCSEIEQVPSYVENEIYELDDGLTSKYIIIDGIEDNDNTYRIYIELQFEPIDYQEVRTWTDAICYDCVKIFKENDVNRDVSVWARKTLSGDRVSLYGRTYYHDGLGKYEFEGAKELFD